MSVGRRLVDGLRKRRRFWESVPRRGHLLILVAVFSIFSAFGFLADMMSLGRLAPTDVVMMAALSGIIAALFALRMIRHAAFIIPAVALLAFMNWMVTPLGTLPPVPDALRPMSDRMRNDSLGVILVLTTGYTFFLVFIAVEASGIRRRIPKSHWRATSISVSCRRLRGGSAASSSSPPRFRAARSAAIWWTSSRPAIAGLRILRTCPATASHPAR